MDKEYLNMVLALPDSFFEGWEYKDGDLFWLVKDNDGDYTPSQDHGVYTVVDGLLATTGWHDIEIWSKVKGFTLEEGRPIPSQEQLQKMVNLTPAEYIDDLYNYTNEPAHENSDQSIFFIDMKCFTLAYVMDRKYRKYWNGTSWEKET